MGKKTSSRRFLVVGHKSGRWVETFVKADSYESAREKAVAQFNHPAVGMDFQDATDTNLYAVNIAE